MVTGLAASLFQGTAASPSFVPVLFWEACGRFLSSRQRPHKNAVTGNRWRVIPELWKQLFPSHMCQGLLLQAGSVMCWNLMQVP